MGLGVDMRGGVWFLFSMLAPQLQVNPNLAKVNPMIQILEAAGEGGQVASNAIVSRRRRFGDLFLGVLGKATPRGARHRLCDWGAQRGGLRLGCSRPLFIHLALPEGRGNLQRTQKESLGHRSIARRNAIHITGASARSAAYSVRPYFHEETTCI